MIVHSKGKQESTDMLSLDKSGH